MGFRYSVLPSAVKDMQDIARHVHDITGDWSRADALLSAMDDTFDKLCQYQLWHPVYQFPDGMQPRHEYRSTNVDTYKVFYRVDEERELVLIYRIRHAASDFTAVEFG